MRWACGPLAIERETRREGSAARDVEALRRWCEPAALEILRGTAVNALVVPWAEGKAADADQPRALAPLVAAAASRGLAVIGWASEPADLRKAAAAARASGLAAIATESTEPLEGADVLRFRKRGLGALATPAFLGDAEAVWPGMRPLKLEKGVDAVSGATSRPWIDSNAWYVRLVRGVLAPKTVWLAFEPPDDGRPVAADSYLVALVDSAAGGGRWLLSLDPALRRGLSEGRADARDIWSRVARGVDFFHRHAAWEDYRPAGQIGVVSDFSGANEFLSHEILNLLARRSALVTAIGKDRVSATSFDGLDAVICVDEAPPGKDLATRLVAFAERGGTLVAPPGWKAGGVPEAAAANPRFELFRLGKGRVAVARAAVDDPERLAEDAELLVSHRHDRVRVYNLGIGQYHYATSGDERAGVLHMVSYPSPYPTLPVAVWFRQPWATGRTWRLDGADGVAAKRVASGPGVEFHLPAGRFYRALEVAG
jgi:hypothetical protein